MNRPLTARYLVGFASAVFCAVLTGCSSEPTASESGAALRIASGNVTATSDMSVSSVAPDSATQDTTLDVVVNGSGFVAGTSANWALSGVQDSTQVRTNATRYVSSRQLVANITISRSATIAKWDVVVSAASKKGGIGTEAFTIQPHVVASTWKLPLNSTGLGLRSDGLQNDGVYSSYETGVCSVSGGIFNGSSGDGTLQTNNPTAKSRTCSGRTMTVVYPTGDPVYPAGGTETMLVFLNIHNISSQTTIIPVGYGNRVLRQLSLNPTQKQRCDAWRWANNSTLPGDFVWVERMDATTFHVYTKDRDPDAALAAASAGLNKAVCTTTGQTHHLSVDLLVVAKEALP
jgi:hypothetical protein